jgi:hypothetical protein
MFSPGYALSRILLDEHLPRLSRLRLSIRYSDIMAWSRMMFRRSRADFLIALHLQSSSPIYDYACRL